MTRKRAEASGTAGPAASSEWASAPLPELAEALATTLLLDSAPVGVRLFRSAEEFEACTFPRPRTALHYCSAVRMAAEGASLRLGADDIGCDTAPRTLGLRGDFLEPEFVETYVSGGLYEDRSHAEEALSNVVTLDGVYGIAVAPLAAFGDITPDVVVVATAPYGAMRLAQAAAFTGERVRSEPIGMHGICSESTAAPHATGKVCTSLMCSGARHESGWDEQSLSAGIPFERLPGVIEGLVSTAQRYETDERKTAMRRSGTRGGGRSHKLAERIDELAEGAAYFSDFPGSRG